MGRAARARALRDYGWESNLAKVGALLTEPSLDLGGSERNGSADALSARLAEHVDEA
jgi:hypothetical protein